MTEPQKHYDKFFLIYFSIFDEIYNFVIINVNVHLIFFFIFQISFFAILVAMYAVFVRFLVLTMSFIFGIGGDLVIIIVLFGLFYNCLTHFLS